MSGGEVSDEPHWVERLFPPAYTLDDVEAATELPGIWTSGSHLRHLFSLDSSTVRAIYERVLFMEKVRAEKNKDVSPEHAESFISSEQQQQQQQQQQQEDARQQLSHTKLGTLSGLSASPCDRQARPKSAFAQEKCRADNSGYVESRGRNEDLAAELTSCPWTSDELNKLRMARRSQEEELSELRLRLAQLENAVVQERQVATIAARERDDLAARERTLTSRERRAAAALRSLAATVEVERRAAAERDATVAALLRQVSDLETELAASRAEVGRLRAAIARAEANADVAASRVAAEAEAAKEILRTESDAKFARVSSELLAAKEEAAIERAAHDRSKMALDRLMLHFSIAQGSAAVDEGTVLRVQY